MILRDPVTGLRNRTGFLTQLGAELQQARLDSATLALLMVNPDHFAPINERFGREAGDEIVCEISRRLRVGLRASDSVSRYGGVIFVITLMDTSLKAAKALAQKLRRGLAEGAYLDGAVRLGFSIGIAVSETDGSDGLEPVDLIRRADQALNAAKRQGGNQVFDWEQRAGVEESGNFDRLSGIFTGNMSKDYRNMVLLSDAIEVIAANREFDALAAEMVEKLYVSYRPDRVALFSVGRMALWPRFGVSPVSCRIPALCKTGSKPSSSTAKSSSSFALPSKRRSRGPAAEPRPKRPRARAPSSSAMRYRSSHRTIVLAVSTSTAAKTPFLWSAPI